MRGLEWFIARRYLASRHRGRLLSLSTVIAIGGIFVGVMALITVIAVMTGLQRELQSKIIGSNPHLYLFEQGFNSFRVDNWRSVVDSIDDIDGIVTAQPFIMTQVGIVPPSQNARAGTLYGIQRDTGRAPLNVVQREVASGSLKLEPTTSGKPGIILGFRMASHLGVGYGDVVKVVSLENIKAGGPTGFIPVVVEFEVTGIFNTGMYEYDTEFMYTGLQPARDLLSFEKELVSGVAVNVEDPWNVDRVRAQIEGRLGFQFWTNDWMQLNGALFSALKLEKLALAIILFLIVLVAAFNIIGTLIMVVADKTREIGILKSMGLTDHRVLRVFVLQGLAIGLVGTALGTIGGTVLVRLQQKLNLIKLSGEVYFLDHLPVELDPLDLLAIVGTSLLITFAATIYPAKQASRLMPVEAIRHD